MDVNNDHKNFLRRLRLASTIEQLLREFEKKIESFAIQYDKEQILDAFEGMTSFLPSSTVVDGLTLMDKDIITWVYTDKKFDVPGVYEINQGSKIYFLYPDVNFCMCKEFRNKVLKENSQFTCPHVLAVRFGRLLKKIVKQREESMQMMSAIYKQLLNLPKEEEELDEENTSPQLKAIKTSTSPTNLGIDEPENLIEKDNAKNLAQETNEPILEVVQDSFDDSIEMVADSLESLPLSQDNDKTLIALNNTFQETSN